MASRSPIAGPPTGRFAIDTMAPGSSRNSTSRSPFAHVPPRGEIDFPADGMRWKQHAHQIVNYLMIYLQYTDRMNRQLVVSGCARLRSYEFPANEGWRNWSSTRNGFPCLGCQHLHLWITLKYEKSRTFQGRSHRSVCCTVRLLYSTARHWYALLLFRSRKRRPPRRATVGVAPLQLPPRIP